MKATAVLVFATLFFGCGMLKKKGYAPRTKLSFVMAVQPAAAPIWMSGVVLPTGVQVDTENVAAGYSWTQVSKTQPRELSALKGTLIELDTKSAYRFRLQPAREGEGEWRLWALDRAEELVINKLLDAKSEIDNMNGPILSIQLDDSGAKDFQHLTGKNVNKVLTICVDELVINAPIVREEIAGGRLQISGADVSKAEFDTLGRYLSPTK